MDGLHFIGVYFLIIYIQFRSFIIFIVASREGHIEVVKLLLEKGPSIEFKDRNGYTPLMFGIYFLI
jgi:hypothetical protein